MKIVQVVPRYLPNIGGVETVVQKYTEYLTQKGYDISIVTTDFTKSLKKHSKINGVNIYRLPSLHPHEAYFFSPPLHLFLKKFDSPETIFHTHSYHAFPALHTIFARKKSKLVFQPHYHGEGHTAVRKGLFNVYNAAIGEKLIEKSDAIVFVSNIERKKFFHDHPTTIKKRKPTFLFNNGVDCDNLEVKEQHPKQNLLLTMSRIESYKGIHHVINAQYILKNKFKEEWQYKIRGEGTFKPQILELIKRRDLNGAVQWLDQLSERNKIEELKNAKIFVLLSSDEAYSIAVAEALRIGTPCIVLNKGGLKQFIDNKACFAINEPITPLKVAQLIQYVNERTKIYPPVQGKVNCWKETLTKLENLYHQLL